MSYLCYLCLLRSVVSNAYWLYIWVTWRVSYKRQELLTLREHLSSPPVFWWGPCGLCFRIVVCVILLHAFMFWVPCCDVRYNFRIKTMFGSSLPSCFVGRLMFYLRYLCLFAHSGVQHILCYVFGLFFFSFCVHYVASFSGLSIYYCTFDFL